MADNDIMVEVENPEELTAEDFDRATVTEEEGGSVIIDFDQNDETNDEPVIAMHNDNLVDVIDDDDLKMLGAHVIDYVEEDKNSREDWFDTYRKGLDALGLKYEDRSEPWPGACGAFHPMLLESVIRFQADSIMELVPPTGPVKTKIIGKQTDAKIAQASRIKQDMNHTIMEKVPDFREAMETTLFNLPMAGSIFRKAYPDPITNIPRTEFILPEDFIVPYGATSLSTTPRMTQRMYKTSDEVNKYIASGFYADVEFGGDVQEVTDAQEKRDEITGDAPSGLEKVADVTLYECHMDTTIPGIDDDDDLAKPYIVTVDKSTGNVMAVRRNWREGDPNTQRMDWYIHYKYLPGLGFYGTGLFSILGGLSMSATSILRQLVDAGTLANLPAGFKTKNARLKGDSTPLMPGEWRDVDVGGFNLKDSFMPLPYKEPSTVLAGLLNTVVEEGRRIGAVADTKIADMTGQNMPVGTTVAILERSVKIMSAVMARVHASFKKELQIISRIMRDYMDPMYDFELSAAEQGASRQTDHDDRIDIVPVSDPNASSMAMRVMKLQAAMQLAATAPDLYDLPALHRRMLLTLDIEDVDEILPAAEEVKPLDPVTENMNLLTNKPVRAGPEQDHEAHIAVHMAALDDPKLQQMAEQNPMAPVIMQAASAHIQEHIAFQYRIEIEKQLGAPLPPVGEPLPEDVEYQLSQLTAQAAEKLLGKNQAEQQAQEVLEKMEDPMVQMQRESIELEKTKEARLDREGRERLELQARKQETDSELAAYKMQFDLGRTLLDAQVRHDETVSGQQMEGAKAGIELGMDVLKMQTEGAKAGLNLGQQKKNETTGEPNERPRPTDQGAE